MTEREFLGSLTSRPIGPDINLSQFTCGNDAVDWFARNKALELHEKRINNVMCWLKDGDLAGLVTTSMNVLAVQDLGDRERLGLQGVVVFREGGKQYQTYPALLIGVLGVCTKYARKGLAETMVRYAIGQALSLSDAVGCR